MRRSPKQPMPICQESEIRRIHGPQSQGGQGGKPSVMQQYQEAKEKRARRMVLF